MGGGGLGQEGDWASAHRPAQTHAPTQTQRERAGMGTVCTAGRVGPPQPLPKQPLLIPYTSFLLFSPMVGTQRVYILWPNYFEFCCLALGALPSLCRTTAPVLWLLVLPVLHPGFLSSWFFSLVFLTLNPWSLVLLLLSVAVSYLLIRICSLNILLYFTLWSPICVQCVRPSLSVEGVEGGT